jgi:hypothetical protein
MNYLRSKKEKRSDGTHNIIHLYECGHYPSLDDLIEIAYSVKRDIPEEYFIHVVFFTDHQYARFATFRNSVYAPDQPETEFIKATYTYCHINGHSTLVCYNKGSNSSQPVHIPI